MTTPTTDKMKELIALYGEIEKDYQQIAKTREKIRRHLAAEIKKERERRGIGGRPMGRLLGTSSSFLHDIENGRRRISLPLAKLALKTLREVAK